jgi:hypothetical protein
MLLNRVIGNLTDIIIDMTITMNANKQIPNIMVMNNVNNSAGKSDKGSVIGLTSACRYFEIKL